MTPREVLTKGFKYEMKLAVLLVIMIMGAIAYMAYDTGKWHLFWYGLLANGVLTLKFWIDRKQKLKEDIKDFEKNESV